MRFWGLIDQLSKQLNISNELHLHIYRNLNKAYMYALAQFNEFYFYINLPCIWSVQVRFLSIEAQLHIVQQLLQ